MRKITQTLVYILYFLWMSNIVFAQEVKTSSLDNDLKEKMYNELKPKVNRFTKKDFDDLFFDFIQKQSSDTVLLTKQKYYNYTLSIAVYSAKLGLLYKDQKATSEKTKQEWYDKNYQEYLNKKQNKK